jgi:hypothetical protein
VIEEIDMAAQDDPEWVVWSSPERIAGVIDWLFTEALPRVPADWKTQTGSAKPIRPMPSGVDRYSDEMALHWVDHAFDYFFVDEDALFDADKTELVDAFVAYIGEYFVRHCDGRWINDPSMGRVLFDDPIRLDRRSRLPGQHAVRLAGRGVRIGRRGPVVFARRRLRQGPWTRA